MADSRKRGRRSQSLTLTLKLLRQAIDGAFLLNDLEEGGVPLLLRLCQLHNHPSVDHTRPCDHGQQIRMRPGASSEPNKERKGPRDSPSRSCDNLALLSRSYVASSVTT
jgi:hypothetical protein